MTDVHAAAAAATTERPTAAAAASTIAALIGVPAESDRQTAQIHISSWYFGWRELPALRVSRTPYFSYCDNS